MFERLLQWIYPDLCIGCGKLGHLVCAACLARAPRYSDPLPDVGAQHVYVCFVYTAVIRQALLLLKYCGKRRYARVLATTLVDTVPRAYAGVVALPAAESRIAHRGYDQAVLLAQSVADDLQLPYCPGLVRTRDTTAQAHLSRQQRAHNVAAAFGWRGPPLSGRVLLIDDICTTGATVREAILAIKAAGMLEVDVAVVARGKTNPSRSNEREG